MLSLDLDKVVKTTAAKAMVSMLLTTNESSLVNEVFRDINRTARLNGFSFKGIINDKANTAADQSMVSILQKNDPNITIEKFTQEVTELKESIDQCSFADARLIVFLAKSQNPPATPEDIIKSVESFASQSQLTKRDGLLCKFMATVLSASPEQALKFAKTWFQGFVDPARSLFSGVSGKFELFLDNKGDSPRSGEDISFDGSQFVISSSIDGQVKFFSPYIKREHVFSQQVKSVVKVDIDSKKITTTINADQETVKLLTDKQYLNDKSCEILLTNPTPDQKGFFLETINILDCLPEPRNEVWRGLRSALEKNSKNLLAQNNPTREIVKQFEEQREKLILSAFTSYGSMHESGVKAAYEKLFFDLISGDTDGVVEQIVAFSKTAEAKAMLKEIAKVHDGLLKGVTESKLIKDAENWEKEFAKWTQQSQLQSGDVVAEAMHWIQAKELFERGRNLVSPSSIELKKSSPSLLESLFSFIFKKNPTAEVKPSSSGVSMAEIVVSDSKVIEKFGKDSSSRGSLVHESKDQPQQGESKRGQSSDEIPKAIEELLKERERIEKKLIQINDQMAVIQDISCTLKAPPEQLARERKVLKNRFDVLAKSKEEIKNSMTAINKELKIKDQEIANLKTENKAPSRDDMTNKEPTEAPGGLKMKIYFLLSLLFGWML